MALPNRDVLGSDLVNQGEFKVAIENLRDSVASGTIDSTSINFSTDSDLTLTDEQNASGYYIFTDNTTVLTDTRNIIISTDTRNIVVKNSTSQTLTIKTATGTGIDVVSGADKGLFCDGGDVVDVLSGDYYTESEVDTLLDGKQSSGTYNTIIGTDTDINATTGTMIDNISVTDGVITSMGTRSMTSSDVGLSLLTQDASGTQLYLSDDSFTYSTSSAYTDFRITHIGGGQDIGTVLRIPYNGIYDTTTASSANVYVDSANKFYRNSSSIKYKTDVQDIEESYINNFFNNARPVYYKSICESDNKDWGNWGFIAEELDLVDKRLVEYEQKEDGTLEPEGVQYLKIIPLLVSKVQSMEKVKLTIEELQIEQLIQSKVNEYNEANGTSFKSIDSCAKYIIMTSYKHYDFCCNIIAWQTEVWEKFRELDNFDNFMDKMPDFKV